MNLIEFLILVVGVVFITVVIVPIMLLSFLGKITVENIKKMYVILFR